MNCNGVEERWSYSRMNLLLQDKSSPRPRSMGMHPACDTAWVALACSLMNCNDSSKSRGTCERNNKMRVGEGREEKNIHRKSHTRRAENKTGAGRDPRTVLGELQAHVSANCPPPPSVLLIEINERLKLYAKNYNRPRSNSFTSIDCFFFFTNRKKKETKWENEDERHTSGLLADWRSEWMSYGAKGAPKSN